MHDQRQLQLHKPLQMYSGLKHSGWAFQMPLSSLLHKKVYQEVTKMYFRSSRVSVPSISVISKHGWCVCLVWAASVMGSPGWAAAGRPCLCSQSLWLSLSLSLPPTLQPSLLGFHVTDISSACLHSNGKSLEVGQGRKGSRASGWGWGARTKPSEAPGVETILVLPPPFSS